MVKLVDTRDLKSLGVILRAGSSPAPGTINSVKEWLRKIRSFAAGISPTTLGAENIVGNTNPQPHPMDDFCIRLLRLDFGDIR